MQRRSHGSERHLEVHMAGNFKICHADFPGGLVVKTLSLPLQGTQI